MGARLVHGQVQAARVLHAARCGGAAAPSAAALGLRRLLLLARRGAGAPPALAQAAKTLQEGEGGMEQA